MVRLSAFADEVSVIFDEQLKYLNEAGIKWMEIRFVDGKNITALSDEEVMEVKAKLRKASIGVSFAESFRIRFMAISYCSTRLKKAM